MYSVTLERGFDGSYLGWVDGVPGCALRAPTRSQVLEELPDAIAAFLAWTCDLRSRQALEEFLAWARGTATARLRELARERSSELTWADWGGAPRPEPWTARKAARRLLWHELLHLRAIERSDPSPTRP